MENISVHVKYLFACEAVRRWAAFEVEWADSPLKLCFHFEEVK